MCNVAIEPRPRIDIVYTINKQHVTHNDLLSVRLPDCEGSRTKNTRNNQEML